jgi:hypothetical protein
MLIPPYNYHIEHWIRIYNLFHFEHFVFTMSRINIYIHIGTMVYTNDTIWDTFSAISSNKMAFTPMSPGIFIFLGIRCPDWPSLALDSSCLGSIVHEPETGGPVAPHNP